MNTKIFMYLPIYFAIIAALSVVLHPLSFDGIDAQISDITVNNTIASDGTNSLNSENQTQMTRINPCLNMMNPGMMTMYGYNNIAGSIKLDPILNNSLSHITISLSQAAIIAEKEIGNNSRSIEAYLCDANGYLVYMIWVRSPDADTTDVIVDPSNGHILLKNSNLFPQQKSMGNHMMMPGMPGVNH